MNPHTEFVRLTSASLIAAAALMSWSAGARAGEQPVAYSGRATVLDISTQLLGVVHHPRFGDTGEMAPSGYTREQQISKYDRTAPPAISVSLLHGITSGANNVSAAEASVAKLHLSYPGLDVSADVIRANSSAECHRDSMTVSTAGSAVLTNLRVNGVAIDENPAPNTVLEIPGVAKLVFNEQYNPDVNTQTVNAIHLTIPGAAGLASADVIVSHAQSGILTCPCHY